MTYAELPEDADAIHQSCDGVLPDLKVSESQIENATILPGRYRYKHRVSGGSFAKGGIAAGVYREDGSYVFESGVVRGADFHITAVGNRPLQEVAGKVDLQGKRSVPVAIYGGYFKGHFGHFLTENLARLWYLLKETDFPVFVTAAAPGSSDRRRLERLFERLAPCQFDFARLNICDDPIKVEKLIVPSAAMHIRHSAAPEYIEALRAITPKIDGDLTPTEQPLFLSRSSIASPKRGLIGAKILDAAMAAQGAQVVQLEKLPFTETVRLVMTHRNIVGPVGSAFHTTVFSPDRNLFYLANAIDPDRLKTYVSIDRINGAATHFCKPKDLMHSGQTQAWQTLLNRSYQGAAAVNFDTFLDQLVEAGLFDKRRFNMSDHRTEFSKALDAYQKVALPAWKYIRYPNKAFEVAHQLKRHVARLKSEFG